MKNWIEAINECTQKGEPFVLVTVLGAEGSTPRDNGTKMVISKERGYGTIGGGHLEYQAMSIAAELISEGAEQQRITHLPLGPRLGQCCGGRITLLFECFPGLDINIMLFGAGHVGQALAAILLQLPCRLHWVDSRDDQHPAGLPANVIPIVSDTPAAEVAVMPANGYYIIMTHNHQMDFEILEAVLKRGDARYVGLIGSDTKWQRFRHRFLHRGYEESFFRTVRCPVGLSNVPGKLPVEVAVSVAAEIIGVSHENRGDRQARRGIQRGDLRVLSEESRKSSPDIISGESPNKSDNLA
jgi:xanthine dehydrogenase accessory factor